MPRGPFHFGFYPGGRFVAENVTLGFVLEAAYGAKDFQVSGGSGWLHSERYNIEAAPENSFTDTERKLTTGERQSQRRQPIKRVTRPPLRKQVNRNRDMACGCSGGATSRHMALP